MDEEVEVVELDDPDTTTVLDEDEDEALERLVLDWLNEEVELLVEVLLDDPEASTVDDEELELALVEEEVEELAEEVVELDSELRLDQEVVDPLDVVELLVELATIVLDVLLPLDEDVEDCEVVDADESDSEDFEEVEVEDELDMEISTVEELDELVDDSSSSMTSVTSKPMGRKRFFAVSAARMMMMDSLTFADRLLTS